MTSHRYPPFEHREGWGSLMKGRSILLDRSNAQGASLRHDRQRRPEHGIK